MSKVTDRYREIITESWLEVVPESGRDQPVSVRHTEQGAAILVLAEQVERLADAADRADPIPSIMAIAMKMRERQRKAFLAKTVANLCDACKQKLRDAGCSLEADYSDVMPPADEEQAP